VLSVWKRSTQGKGKGSPLNKRMNRSMQCSKKGIEQITENRKNSKGDRNGVVRADDLVRAGNPSVVEIA